MRRAQRLSFLAWLALGGCTKCEQSRTSGVNALGTAQQAVERATKSRDRKDLDEAARLLDEVSDGASPEQLRTLRAELGSAYLRNTERRFGLVSSKTLAPNGAAATCGMGSTVVILEEPIDAGRAYQLLSAADVHGDAAWAAYRAGNLRGFDEASRQRDVGSEEQLQRLRLLVRAGEVDEALAEAERVAAIAPAAAACGAWLVSGQLRERRGEHGTAREAYAHARDAEPLGECGRGAQARLAAIEGLSEGAPIPTATVRGNVTVPARGDVLVTLIADPIDGRSAPVPSARPSDWRSIDRYIAVSGPVRNGHFELANVPRGEWTLMVVAEGGARYRTSQAACWQSVRVDDKPIDVGQITITEAP